MANNYTEEQLGQIAKDIIKESTATQRKNQTFFGKFANNDWEDEAFIADLYDQFLKSIQQEKSEKATGKKYDLNSTFPEYLGDCLDTLKIRREELSIELANQMIDQRIYQNGKELAEMAEAAIRQYLGKTPTQRLIGV